MLSSASFYKQLTSSRSLTGNFIIYSNNNINSRNYNNSRNINSNEIDRESMPIGSLNESPMRRTGLASDNESIPLLNFEEDINE